MDHNPYTPPQANTEASIPGEVVPRPVAVWLLIILLLMFALMFVTSTVRMVGTVSAHWDEIRGGVALAGLLVWHLALTVIFFGVAYSAYRRRPWSRWFGVILIVVFAAFIIFGVDTTHYANSAERSGGQLARFVVPPLLAWWAYVLALSPKAKRYFSRSLPGAATTLLETRK